MVIADFRTPPDAKYAHALTQCVNSVVQHLQSARPMAVSMGNAVKSLKTHLARMSEEPASCEEESRRKTLIHLEYFEQEKLLKAGRSIAEHGASEIRVGDVVVAYGASRHAREILREARRRGVDFRVVVVDSGVNREARETLRALLRENIACTYTTLGGLGYVFREGGATKVLLGAAAVLANGAVVSRAGAAVVAACAAAADVPVLVAAETCKDLHERVHLDAVAHNELGNPARAWWRAGGGGRRRRRRSSRSELGGAATRRRRCEGGEVWNGSPSALARTTSRPRRASRPSCARADSSRLRMRAFLAVQREREGGWNSRLDALARRRASRGVSGGSAERRISAVQPPFDGALRRASAQPSCSSLMQLRRSASRRFARRSARRAPPRLEKSRRASQLHTHQSLSLPLSLASFYTPDIRR